MGRKKKKIEEQWFFKSNEDKKEELKSHSWFNINILKNPDFTEHAHRDDSPNIEIIKTKVIELYPTSKQREILLQWMDSFINMYNSTNRYINNNIYDHESKKVLPEVKTILNFRKLRDEHLKEKKIKHCQNNINKHLLDEAIAHCVSKHKSAITNFTAGHNKFFRLRKMKKDRRKKILTIEQGLFSKKKMNLVHK